LIYEDEVGTLLFGFGNGPADPHVKEKWTLYLDPRALARVGDTLEYTSIGDRERLFGCSLRLVVGQIMATNPAAPVRGPKYTVKKGKTPVLTRTKLANSSRKSIPRRCLVFEIGRSSQ
jgi:hypothetical protein